MFDAAMLLIILAVAIYAAVDSARTRHHDSAGEHFKWPR